MPTFKERVRIKDVEAIRETEKALLCVINGEEVWIPQSQIDDDSEIWEAGQEGTLIVSKWLAREKGWL